MILCLLLVLAAVWLPRALKLNQFVTSDESRWLIRSGNFLSAVSTGEFEQTFQHGHPGVTIMWLGTLGYLLKFPDYVSEAQAQFGWKDDQYEAFIKDQGQDPLALLAAGRLMVVLANMITFGVAFWVWVKLVGLHAGLLGFLLIAFDPFQIAFARFLHPDGLLYSLMLLAVVASIGYVVNGNDKGISWRWLTLAGVSSGLAWLTKTPGLFLVPYCGLIFFIQAFLGQDQGNTILGYNFRGRTRHFAAYLGVWLLTGCATFILCWPAMWVAPMETLSKVLDISTSYAVGGHDNPIFFDGQTFYGDPGAKYYPLTVLWRLTPVVIFGLLGGLFWAIFSSIRNSTAHVHPKNSANRLILVALAGFVILFGLFMSLGAKKFDRYLLPIYPVLALTAGIGWSQLGGWLTRSLDLVKQRTMIFGLSIVVIVSQAAFAAPHFPYYISFYNPMLGSGEEAKSTLSVGWGEGMDAAARHLNNVVNEPSELTVASWHWRSPFSYFFEGNSVPLDFFWDAEFTVLYASQQQRMLPARQVARYFARQQPAERISLGGTDYAAIYEMGALPNRYGTTWQLDEQAVIELVSYSLFPGLIRPGSEQELILHLVNRGTIDQNLSILLRIVNQAGDELFHVEQWPYGAATKEWDVGELWLDKYLIPIPVDAADGLYRIELSFYEPTTLMRLPAVANQDGHKIGETVILDYLTISSKVLYGAGSAPTAATIDLPVTLGNFVDLVDYRIRGSSSNDVTFESGMRIDIEVQWQAVGYIDKELTTFVHLVGPDGSLQAQGDRPPLDGFLPLSLWNPGLAITDVYSIELPDTLSTGDYELFIGLYDRDTGERMRIKRDDVLLPDALSISPVFIVSK